MGRLFTSVILAVVLAASAAYFFDLNPFAPEDQRPGKKGKNKGAEVTKEALGRGAVSPSSVDGLNPPIKADRSVTSIRIPGLLQPMDKYEAASSIDGNVMILGDEISPAVLPQVAGFAPFLLEPCNIAKVTYQTVEPIKGTDKFQFVDREFVPFYRRHLPGQMVTADQTLAILNPIKALAEMRVKQTKIESADAETRAAIATEKEAQANHERALRQYRDKVIAEQDYRIAYLTWVRHKEEAISKALAARSATIELEQARVYYNQHDIRNQLRVGRTVIKEIFKETGESIKPQDKIMKLYGIERFMAEGLLSVGDLTKIKPGMKVTIEPTTEESPVRVFKAHRAEITSVAVTRDPVNPLIVSASEDHNVLVWDRKSFGPVHYLSHDQPVRVVACSPTNPKLILAGCADGKIYLWDLDHPSTPKQVPSKEAAHREAVSALAFSPNGDYFVSGSVDSSIKLWDVKTLESKYPFIPENLAHAKPTDTPADAPSRGAVDLHHGAITSLHITPQCLLVSASRDNTVRVWELYDKGAVLRRTATRRSGTVTQLGVSGDGRFMLFDVEKGKTLQVLSVAEGRLINTLENPGEPIIFDTTAVFSADSTLVLTAGAAEGRLQLWTRPTAQSRSFEVRQYVNEERSSVTCAAFGPQTGAQGSIAVSGSKDGYVYLWSVPSTDEVRTHRIEDVPLTTINPTLNATTNQLRIGVQVPNQFSTQYPTGRLISNRPVTMTIFVD